MMATKGMGSTVVLNVLLWLALVISIPLAGFRPIYVTVAIVGAVLLGLMAALVVGLTRGAERAGRILRAIGDKIPYVGGARLENIVLQADESLRRLARDRRVLVGSLTWASLNWLLDAASLWCFIAAFGSFTNPVGLFAAYGIANVLGAIPITPAGLGVIDSVTPVLLVTFGLTRSVATLGVLAWRLVNFWLPIPTGAVAFISLKVPRGSSWADRRKALADMVRRNRNNDEDTDRPDTGSPGPDGPRTDNPDTGTPGPDGPGPDGPADGGARHPDAGANGGTPAATEEDHARDRT
jgi:uncharacterized membrane protein YbhN (UPF0104 family)